MIIYAAGGETPAPWIAEASLAVDWTPLNPSPDEVKKLKSAGFAVERSIRRSSTGPSPV